VASLSNGEFYISKILNIRIFYGWSRNERMINSKYDLIVIGTGVAASHAASKCSSSGWKVAIIDYRPFGGTCALRGCDPKKVLVSAEEVIDWNYRMQGKGVSGKEIRINWSDLAHFKRSFTDPFPKAREEGFLEAGITPFHGHAQFIGPTTIEVQGNVLTSKYVLVATGTKPVKLDIPGEENVIISDQFLELDKLPPRILFIGGGYISFEFAHIAARAGAEVSIVHRGIRPLENFDFDLVKKLMQRTEDLGINIHLQAQVDKVEQNPLDNNNSFIVYTSSSSSSSNLSSSSPNQDITRFQADMVVHGAGRVPDVRELDLEVAGVQFGNKGIIVNEYLQSVSNPTVYAAGDVAATGNPLLTPSAEHEGKIAASNLLNGNHQISDTKGAIPSIVFTIPPMAAVGIGEETAKKQGLRFRTNYEEDTSSWYSSRRVGENFSAFKVLIEEGSDRILGAHIVSPHAEEQINIFALAIQRGITSKDLKEIIFAYPTGSSDIVYML
jgi:glutathione reductase (NADPH)